MGGEFIQSTIEEHHLEPFVDKGILPPISDTFSYRLPGDETSPKPEPGEFVVFLSFLERGLAFPTCPFFRRFLHFFQIKISDLSPHCFEHLSNFISFCESFLGCPAYFPLWLHLFHGRYIRERAGGPMQECGGVIFQLRDSSKFVDPEFPKRITGNWRETWFYASELPADGECPLAAYTSVRSSPRHLSTRNFTPDEEAIIDQMMARVTRLQAQGLSAGHLFNTWAGRRMSPLQARSHPMWEYTGSTFPPRHSTEAWDEKEFIVLYERLTQAPRINHKKLPRTFTCNRPRDAVSTFSSCK
jgi:hypothetical protein